MRSSADASKPKNSRMPMLETVARTLESSFTFELSPDREAREPAEVRGSGRDDVRLLVTTAPGSLVHARFAQLPSFLAAGDLVVLNRSATIPAALAAQRSDGNALQLHVSTRLPADLFVVEAARTRVLPLEHVRLPGGGLAEFLTPYRTSQRLWVARLYLPTDFGSYVARYCQPIRYRHVKTRWPLEAYQNVYATEPGSAEMPSAGRPFTQDMLARLREMGVETAFITLHAGVSSPERDEPPYEETYQVPAETADAVRRTRRTGGRIVAVGTTVVRALESALDQKGRVVASQGWTDLVINPERGVSTVDGILTGFHEPKSSHLAMLEAIAGRETIRKSYAAALALGYRWHEFGDSQLILPRAA
jgi:S-adenosylmethionine:tRNA ribosyltransferase-isomerase